MCVYVCGGGVDDDDDDAGGGGYDNNDDEGRMTFDSIRVDTRYSLYR